MSLNKKNVVLFFIFAAGLSLRLYRIGVNDLWYDEALSFIFSDDFKFSRIIHHDLHPPLYYMFLSFWIKIFGSSELTLRLPSAIFSAATIPIVYKIGKTLFNHRVSIVATLFFALSPFQIWYAQEARSYAMSVFFTSLTVMFLAQILYEDKRHIWKYFIISSLLCVLTEYVNFLVLLSLTPLFLSKKDLCKKWVLSWGVVFLGFSVWLYPFWRHVNYLIKRGDEFWIPRPVTFSMFETLKNFALGYGGILTISGMLLFGFFTFFGIFKLLKYRSRLIFIALPFFTTIAAVFVISNYSSASIYLDRQLISVSIFYYLLVAGGINMINGRFIKIVPLSLMIIFIILSLKEHYFRVLPDSKKPFKPLAEFINDHKSENDIVIFGTEVMAAPLRGYYLRDMSCYSFRLKDDYIKERHWDYDRPAEIVSSPEDITRGQRDKKVWLLTGCWERDGTLDYSSRLAKKWISTYGTLLRSKAFDGIFVDLFTSDVEGEIYEN